jgi:hypothetical protein
MSGTNDRASLLAASVKHHLYSRYLKYEALLYCPSGNISLVRGDFGGKI